MHINPYDVPVSETLGVVGVRDLASAGRAAGGAGPAGPTALPIDSSACAGGLGGGGDGFGSSGDGGGGRRLGDRDSGGGGRAGRGSASCRCREGGAERADLWGYMLATFVLMLRVDLRFTSCWERTLMLE